MRVRDLEWNDFKGWAELYYSRYDEVETNKELGVFTFDSKPTWAEEARRFGERWKEILEGDLLASVAEEDGTLVGLCTVHRKGRHREDRHVGILAIALHPQWRGRGVGRELLTHALRKCRGKFEALQLNVLQSNIAAMRLYRSCGFVEAGRLPRAFKRDGVYFDDVVMWRAIDPDPQPDEV